MKTHQFNSLVNAEVHMIKRKNMACICLLLLSLLLLLLLFCICIFNFSFITVQIGTICHDYLSLMGKNTFVARKNNTPFIVPV